MSRPGDKLIQLSGKILGETTKAVRFSVEGVAGFGLSQNSFRTVWLPLSQIKAIVRQPPASSEDDTLEVSEWIWRQKIEDSWGGNDPVKAGTSEVDLEQADDLDDLEDLEDYDDEVPPW